MTADLPSLDLLRSLSDRHVLAAVAATGRATRAAVATSTGLSKPTVSQSVTRLLDAGVLVEAERTTGGRGRAGTNLAIDPVAGCALAVQAGPEGVIGEVVALDGRVLVRHTRTVAVPVTARALGRALVDVCRVLTSDSPGPVRVVTVSVADPVDRRTGRVVELPESPFLVGELDVVSLLAEVVPVRPFVENDVSWALHAERAQGVAQDVPDVLQLYLDEGMGAAICSDRRQITGSRGLVGEIAYASAHIPARGSRKAVSGTLISCIEALGYLRDTGRAVDTERLLADLEAARPNALAVAHCVADVARAHAYLLDPSLVVLSGVWGRHTQVVEAVTTALGDAVGIEATVTAAAIVDEAPLVGARTSAQDLLLDTWL